MEVNLEISPESVASSLPQVSGSCVENTKEPCEVQQLLSEPDIQIKLEPEDPPSDVDYTDTWISELSTLQYIKEEVEIEVPDYDEPNSSICTVSSSEHQLLEPDFASENLENLDVFQENHADDPYDMEIKQENIELGLESEPVGNQIFINKLKTEYKTDFKLNLKPQVQLERLSPETFNQHKDLYGSAWPYGTNITRKNKRLRCNGNYSTAKRESGKIRPEKFRSQVECVCNKCRKKIKSQVALKSHMKTHSDSLSFMCPICPYGSDSSHNFTMHMSGAHSVEKPFACKHCGYRTANKYHFGRHLVLHSKTKSFKCTPRPFSADKADCLSGHVLKVHSEEENKLKVPKLTTQRSEILSDTRNGEVCGLVFEGNKVGKSLLRSFTVCSRLNRYSCPRCSFICDQYNNFRNHLKIHVKNENVKYKNRLHDTGRFKPLTTNKPLTCNFCAYRTTDLVRFNDHLAMHAGIKPHKCSQCSFESTWSCSLKKHIKKMHKIGKPTLRRRDKVLSVDDLPSINDKGIENSRENMLACPDCNYRSAFSWRLAWHLIVECGEKPYSCKYCSFASKWQSDLKKHLQSNHSETKPAPELLAPLKNGELSAANQARFGQLTKTSVKEAYNCNQCSYRVSLKHLLTRHQLMIHSNQTSFKCEQCPFVTKWEVGLKRHNTWKHSKIECMPKSLNKKGNAKRQPDVVKVDVHSETLKRFDCLKCKYKTGIKQDFKKHMLNHRDTITPFNCSSCQLRFTQKVNLMAHMVKFHNKDKTLSVDGCRLRNSVSTGAKKLICPHCKYNATSSNILKRHLITHSKTKPHRCTKCPYVCSLEHSLKLHIKEVHLKTKSTTGQIGKKKLHTSHKTKRSVKTLLVCPKCDYHTNRKSRLKRHSIVHSHERPFKCIYCSFTFKRSERLNTHVKNLHAMQSREALVTKQIEDMMKTNSPLICPTCNYSTQKKSDLASHMKAHSGIKHNCPKCSYSSMWRRNLKQHMKVKHA